MKSITNCIYTLLGILLISSCSILDDTNQSFSIDETILSAAQIVEVSKATKIINTLAIQEVLKNEKFAGNFQKNEQGIEVRSNDCPVINPDPENYDPTVLTLYTLEFDQCAFSDQLIGLASTPIIIGTVNISLIGELGHSGCEFRIFGTNLSIGSIRYRSYDITQIQNEQSSSETCFTNDMLNFSTIIDALDFSVSGLAEFGEEKNILSVVKSSNATTIYTDNECDTDINDFITLIDDKIILQADTIISGFMDGEKIIERNIYTEIETEFDLICPCPISQSFNILRAGATTLTCFDSDSETCDDDITCLTTTIPLDCRF